MSDDTKQVPPVKPEYIGVQLHKEDLANLVELLNVTADVYLSIARNALNQGDEQAIKTATVRAKLCASYREHLKTNLLVGEPTSRDIH